jgi:hypothetical protein
VKEQKIRRDELLGKKFTNINSETGIVKIVLIRSKMCGQNWTILKKTQREIRKAG